jgi:sigma-B regulation protein RsbU (phosphoserine phosphatase)
LCSAGQTQPIHVSAQTGEAVLVTTRGDTFPLGIIEDATYEETQLKLEPGDKVILYTDGIVEAMNEQKEMLGFERILETVQKSNSATADALLQEIVDRVNKFAGTTPQHDDITVIAIRVTD